MRNKIKPNYVHISKAHSLFLSGKSLACRTAALLFLLPFLLFSSLLPASEISFIVHPSVNLLPIGDKEISLIFTGKVRFWNSGERITPCILETGELKNTLIKDYIGMSTGSFNMYWKRILFTGHGNPPKTFKTEEEIITYVKKTPGAIGIISSGKEILNDDVGTLIIRRAR
ncbi:Uncharacterized protein SCG7109_AB_00190 [Chlamydiales bacterium SCGC AG-110-M15]|nr:Uncharacterized protein SCG7109_AB_00190 [Chlamydiales bacterium SCGC AG-110-M15]